jgi:DeoR/GlpR family transcriptional regulator of sugar metabolism
MIVQDRHGAILDHLLRRPRLRLSSLQSRLKISRSTLRRDLMELEGLGKVVRLRGHVVHADHLKGEPTYDLRRSRQTTQKRLIGQLAAKLIPLNASVFIDAGTTTMEAARLLLDRADLRIFTNSLRIVRRAIASEAVASVVCIGGAIKPVSEALVGSPAIQWMQQLNFDIAIIGASGLNPDGASTTELSEADVKRQAIARAAKVILLADLSKWNAPSTVQFADWADVDALITESTVPQDLRRVLSQNRVESVTE